MEKQSFRDLDIINLAKKDAKRVDLSSCIRRLIKEKENSIEEAHTISSYWTAIKDIEKISKDAHLLKQDFVDSLP